MNKIIVQIRTLSFVIIVLLQCVICRVNGQVYEPIVASPEVAELGKYGNWPVDYYHGQPNIGVPIYTLKVGELTLPISLSYHASGITVDQEATWVGLGWSLNAGGIISRTVKGDPDDSDNLTIKSFDEIDEEDYPSMDDLESYVLGGSDGEPDIYSFNFAGYSGRFMLSNDDEVCFLENTSGLRISHAEIDDDEVFEIQNNKGVKYVFSKKEYGESIVYPYSYIEASGIASYIATTGWSQKTVSGWLLTNIIAPNKKDSISFSYEADTSISLSKPNGSLYSMNGTIEFTGASTYSNSSYTNSGTFNITFNRHYGYRLKSITSSNNIKIEFEADFERKDKFLYYYIEDGTKLQTANALSKITISYDDDPQKVFKLNYDYFNSGITTDDVLGEAYYGHFLNWFFFSSIDDYSSLNYRLKLTDVVQYNGDETESLPPYEFTYYGDNSSSPQMPFRYAFSGVDLFGYCNANLTSSNAEEAGSIYNLFPNIVQGLKSVLDCIEEYGTINSDYLGILGGGSAISTRQYNYFFTYPTSGSTFSNTSFSGSEYSPDIDYCQIYNLKKIKYPTQGSTSFEYELNTYNNVGITYNTCFSYSVYYGGGLRIKEMVDWNGAEAVNTRDFSYLQNEDMVLSSGVIPYDQIWVHPYYTNCQLTGASAMVMNSAPITYPGPVGYQRVKEITENGTVIYNYYTPVDLPASYESRYFGVYAYTAISFSPYKLNFPLYPYLNDIIGKQFYWGNLKNKTVLDTDDNTVLKESYNYDFIEGDPFWGMNVENFTSLNKTDEKVESSDFNLRVNIYKIPTGKTFLNNKRVVHYFDGDSVAQVTNYEYDYENELLTKETEESSKGVTLKTTYKYPTDYDDGYLSACSDEMRAIDTMVKRNIINEPLEVVQYRDGDVVSATLKTFQQFDDLIVPYNIYQLAIDEPVDADDFDESCDAYTTGFNYDDNYEIKYEFKEFDDYGNILELEDNTTGFTTSYLWGYDNTLPIAKAINAESDEIYFTSFEDEPYIYTWHDGNSFATDKYHTGTHSFKIENSESSESYFFTEFKEVELDAATTFKYSCWVYSDGPEAQLLLFYKPNTSDGVWDDFTAVNVSTSTFGRWVYLEGSVSIPTTTQSIYLRMDNNGGGNVWFDDLKFYPAESQMTTYTHKPLVGVTSVTDANNQSTQYEYDDLGRLFQVLDNDGNVINEYEYNYK